MEHYRRILFVSNEDTARAPMAVGLLKEDPTFSGLTIESRGIVVLFPEPINEKAKAIMISNGIHMENHTSRPLTEEDFAEDTLLLTMSKKEYVAAADKFPDHENLYSLSSFIGIEEDLMDPYGMSLREYGICFEWIRLYIKKLSDVLQGNTEDDDE